MATSRKRNVLLVIADDLGRDIKPYGKDAVDTPSLDKLASQGTVFEHAYASTASCSGSRSTIYTGLHTHQNGQYGLQRGYRLLHYFTTFRRIETLPKIFNQLGWLTGLIGKCHVGPPEVYPYAVRHDFGGRNVSHVAERTEEFIQKAKESDKPFILTVGYIDPHRDMTRGGFGNDKDYPNVKRRGYDPKTVAVPSFLTDLPEVRQELAEYYEAIYRMDQGVGMLMDVLERQGVAEDTMVIFVSDNGPPFINSKTTLYDAGVRLPMIVRCPGKKAGTRNPNLVSFLDILPTCLDWAGQGDLKGAKPERQGTSFLPILDSETPLDDWSIVFGSHTFHETTSYYPTRFLRNRRWKYHRNIAWKLDFPFAGDLYGALSFEGIRNMEPPVKIGERLLKDYIQRPAEQLFDLENDPNEVVNLAEKPEYQEKLKELRATLEQWQRDTSDQWLVRDGISMGVIYNHLDAGLQIPDRFDFDVDNPGSKDNIIEHPPRWKHLDE